MTIQLNKNQSTLVTAVNGAGKSATMLDSLCFGLFNKAYRDITKPQLVNSINQKKCMVEIGLSVGKKKYVIKRGIKPSVFEIWENGKMLNQDPNVRDYQKVLEQQILKMNYRAFTQVVVMGSAGYVPFMKLPTAQRREFIEDLLDIRVFSVMNKSLAVQIKEVKEELKLVESNIASSKDVIKVIESYVDVKKTEITDKISTLNEEKVKINEVISTYTDKKTSIQVETKKKQVELSEIAKFKDIYDDICIKKKKLEKKITEFSKEKDHYEQLVQCPTCTQEIHDDVRHQFIGGVQQQIDQINDDLQAIWVEETEAMDNLKDSSDLTDDIFNLNEEVRLIGEKIYGNSLLIKKINKELLELEDELATESPDRSKLREVAKKVVTLVKRKKEIIELQQLQTAAQMMLQDTGIKSKIIKQYIPTINKMVNKYLNQLELFVNFTLDENFNEVIKSRHRDTFTYDSFSQGERQRLDLAFIFTWRAIASLKNSINTNLIILDEVADASMDTSGFEQCLNLFHSMKNNNIFIVSHREAIADKFKSVLKLVKRKNFTEIEGNP